MGSFSHTLLAWYKIHKRDLPWRNTTDPYRIWISEIILQQTRVAQGYDYYLRFLERFPDYKILAAADEDEVLRLWQGLGYYSRARNLHSAAKSIGDNFPDTYKEVRALKGVGDYTAAAICSIAYGLPYAVVDGNVYRVLSRYFGVELPVDSTDGKKYFAKLAGDLLDKEVPGDYNQALMDFGALQCVPKLPDCPACPFKNSCWAYGHNKTGNLPLKEKKVKQKYRYFNYIYVRMGEYTFLKRREENDIWRNLFEFPLIETNRPVDVKEFNQAEAYKSLFTAGEYVPARILRKNVKHVLSHRIIIANFYEVELPENSSSFGQYLKIKRQDTGNFAVSRLVRNFLDKSE